MKSGLGFFVPPLLIQCFGETLNSHDRKKMCYGFSEHRFVFSLPSRVAYHLFLKIYPVMFFPPKLSL